MGANVSIPSFVPGSVAALVQLGRYDDALMAVARLRGSERVPGDLARAAQWVREAATEHLLDSVGPRSATLVLADPTRALDGADERYVLGLVDGVATLDRLLDLSTLGHFRTALALSSLVACGAVSARLAPAPSASHSSTPAPGMDSDLAADGSVVVADGSPTQAALTRTLLRTSLPRGAKLVTVASGSEALESAKRSPPMLMVAEYVLPGFDGLELTRRLREHSATARTRVLLVAQRIDAESLRPRLGAHCALAVRPIDAKGLKDVLARLDVRA